MGDCCPERRAREVVRAAHPPHCGGHPVQAAVLNTALHITTCYRLTGLCRVPRQMPRDCAQYDFARQHAWPEVLLLGSK